MKATAFSLRHTSQSVFSCQFSAVNLQPSVFSRQSWGCRTIRLRRTQVHLQARDETSPRASRSRRSEQPRHATNSTLRAKKCRPGSPSKQSTSTERPSTLARLTHPDEQVLGFDGARAGVADLVPREEQGSPGRLRVSLEHRFLSTAQNTTRPTIRDASTGPRL